MDAQVDNNVAAEAAPEVVAPEQPVEVESGLPSDVDARESDNADAMALPERWNSVKEMEDHIKNMEDKYSVLKNEVTTGERKQVEEIEATKAEVEQTTIREQTINDSINEYVANGMNLTAELTQKLEDVGIPLTEIELGAYKFKEARQKNASYVGGEENFVEIMSYVQESFNEQEHSSLKEMVDNMTTRGISTQPLMLGLQAMYEKSMNIDSPAPDRVRGDVSTKVNGGYETRQELFRDKAYIDSPAGKNDKGAIAKYKQRLAMTPDEVWR